MRLTSTCAHSFGRNWQLPFLNQQKGGNDHKNISWSISTKECCQSQQGSNLQPRWLTLWKHAYTILDPLKPHFYILKLGFTGVDIIFLISAQNIDCGYSLEPPRWHRWWYSLELPRPGSSNEYRQSMFWAEIWKKKNRIFIWKLSVFGGEILSIFE